jgi:putative membrane protein
MNAGSKGKGLLQLKLCWLLLLPWVPISLYSVVPAFGTPASAWAGATQGLLLVLIMAMHGSLSYGWKGFGAYVGIVGVSSFLLEACSIATGFPFGFYHHQGAPGPAPLGVPVSVMMGYVALGWFAWTLARLIVRQTPWRTTGIEKFVTPLIGGFVLAGFDYPLDPIGSTVRNMWVYHHPSGQFGVPLTNYLGWIFTGWISFQLFAFLEHRFEAGPVVRERRFWLLPAIVWLTIGLQYPILFANAPAGTVDIGTSHFLVADIFEAAVAASLFSMIFVALLALTRLSTLRDA